MIFDFKDLYEIIASSKCITIFRHEHPDWDALGSQWALKCWIQDNFPSTEVYALGYETTPQCEFPAQDNVDDEIVKRSTAIILDTANIARIDDDRARQAQKIVKVDHHPNREPFGDPCLVFDQAAATCEILTTFFYMHRDTCKVSALAAKYLYRGILTDTLCYRTTNTTAHTLQAGAYLSTLGIDMPYINQELFDVPYTIFTFQNMIRNSVKYEDGLAYVILHQEDYEKQHITSSEARNYIDQIGHVKDFEVWAMITEDDEHKGIYNASLRSKELQINDIAEKYHGGGHRNASGVKNLDPNGIESLLQDLRQRISTKAQVK